MVQDGQNDFVHVLPQAQVNLLLLLQSIHQLGDTQREKKVSKISPAVLSDSADQPHPWKRCRSPPPDTEL